jgi:hypothetical protein
MVPEVCREPHFLHAVVYFMELPEKRIFMQEDMGEPLEKIEQHKEDYQLQDHGPSREI